jgi:leucyl-tRNA synthetase
LPAVHGEEQREVLRAVHAAAKSGIDETHSHRFHYNTTLARLDELVNAMTKLARGENASADAALLYAVHALPLLLAPFAPHIAEELWHRLGYEGSVHLERWIAVDSSALAVSEITLVVQINGKIRSRLTLSPGCGEEDVLALALEEANVQAHLTGKEIRKRIFVPDKLLNLVVG